MLIEKGVIRSSAVKRLSPDAESLIAHQPTCPQCAQDLQHVFAALAIVKEFWNDVVLYPDAGAAENSNVLPNYFRT